MKVLVPDYAVEYLTPRLSLCEPSVELIPVTVDGEIQGDATDAEVMYKYYIDHYPPYSYGREALSEILLQAPRLRWVHSGKAGVEDMLVPELVESEIVLTNGAGAPKLAIAENVLAYILADAKELHAHYRKQQSSEWKFLAHRELPGMNVAILGLGKIGVATARLCVAMGMRVIGTKRNVSNEPVPYVEEVFHTSRQNECVANADYVVVAAALTPETRDMVNGATFAAMKPGAVLINIARGEVVDESALIEALQSGRLKGAYLDVVSNEPLPADSPLWAIPNVVITPHNSHDSQNLVDHMAGGFLDNFKRYCAGEGLQNVVDKRTGY